LVDKSLLYHTLTGRYTLHELVRQYAGSKLHALPGGEDAAHDRHCTYYTEFLYAHTASLEGGAQAESEAAISADIDNIRAAWQWAAIHSKTHELQHAVTGLFYFYELRNWFAEGDDLCQLAIKHLRHANADNVVHNEEHVRVSGQILAVQAAFCFRRYPSMYATELLYSSLALLRQIDAQAEQAQPLFLLGLLAYLRGEYTEAQQRLHESLALSSKHNNQWLMAHVLGVLGMVAHAEGDLATARGSMYDGIAIFRSLGDQHYITRGLSQLSVVECSMRAYDTAYALLHESIALSRTNGDRWGLAISLNHLGMLEYTRGHFATAHSLLKEGLASCVDLGDLRESAHAHICLGDVAAAIGDDDDAFQHYQAAIQTAQEAQVLPMTVRALYGVATLLVKQGHYAVAIPLLHAILHHAASEQEIKTSAAKLIRQCNEQAVPQHEADYDLPEWAQMVGGTVPQLAHINLDALFLEHPP
jgi:tetratricopeptide (TPR) repeat protein